MSIPFVRRAILVLSALLLVTQTVAAQTTLNPPQQETTLQPTACAPLLPADFGIILQYNDAVTLDSDLRMGLFNLVTRYVQRADGYVAQNQPEFARRYYTYAANYLQYLFDQYNASAFAKTADGDVTGAVADYVRAYTLSVNLAAVLDRRGQVEIGQADYQQAVDDISRALELVPQMRVNTVYAQAFYEVGNEDSRFGRYAPAVFSYTRAIALRPEYHEAYHNRANAYHRLQFYDQAVDDFTCATRLDTDYAPNYHLRGRSHAAAGETQLAIADFTTALNMNPRLSLVRMDRALAYEDLNDYVKAITDLTWAVIIDPNAADAYNLRGMAYYDIGLFREAVADYNRAIQIDPTRANVYQNRAWALAALNQDDSAQLDLFQFIGRIDYALPRAIIEALTALTPDAPTIDTEARG